MLNLRFIIALVALVTLLTLEFQKDLLGPKTVDVYGNTSLVEKAGVLYFKGLPFTGTTVERFPDKSVYRSTGYQDGIRHGISEEFGFTGAIKHRWNYKKGLKHGAQYGWYLEGPKKFVQNYKEGLFHGDNTEWFISGQLFRHRYFEKGVETASKVHFNTGELHTNYVKREGAIYGLKTGSLCMDFKKEGEVQ